MIHKILIAGGVLALCACATVETPTTVAEAPAAPTAAAAPETAEAEGKDRIICKGDRTTGSRIRRDPICKTAREWEIIASEATDFVDQRRNNTFREGDSLGGN